MLLAVLTLSHVLISLAGIVYGLVVAHGMISGRIEKRRNDWFLLTTLANSVSGFFFPVQQLLPSHVIGIVSVIVLAVAAAALWRQGLRGPWLNTYAIGAIVALYLNVFVLVVQLFRRVPLLNELAPSQTEPAFQLTQGVTLVAFVAIGIMAVKGVKKMPHALVPGVAV